MSLRGFFCFARRELVSIVLLGVILVLGAVLRQYGLAWDEGYLFHPDERQILMVASNLELPKNEFELFSTNSPMNPHFFAYGSFPLYLLRALAPFAPQSDIVGPWQDDSLARVVLFGRAISGVFDLGTIVVVYLLGRRLYGMRVGLLASACVAVTVLNIQLSHYYAVDTLLTFFILAALYAAQRYGEHPTRSWQVMCGIALGLALATKISAAPLVFPIAYAVAHARGIGTNSRTATSLLQRAWDAWRKIRRPFLQICAVALVVFILTQPYTLIDWYEFGRDVIREGFIARGWLDVPYTLQFAHTLPYIYQIDQSAVWGMGLPLGIFAWGGAAFYLYQYWREKARGSDELWHAEFLFSWSLTYFLLIGGQYVKYPRYLLPLLPILYIMAARVVFSFRVRRAWAVTVLVFLVLSTSLAFSLAFVSIYSREHPWLSISRWIYENCKPGSVLAIEPWDDALPVLVNVGGSAMRGSEYRSIVVPVYDQDSQAKLQEMADDLSRADYVIIASRRAYGSVERLPERYPQTSRYYRKLFAGELGFEIAETTYNNPQLANWQIRDDSLGGMPVEISALLDRGTSRVWNWGFADESLSVYDHPQPFVLSKTRSLTPGELFELLSR